VNEPEAAVWMGRLVELSRNGDELPDPVLIWWRARLLDKQAARARVVRPMAIAQWASLVAAAITMIVLCAVNWTGIRGMMAPFGFATWAAVGGAIILMGVALRFVGGE
jgi:amino acid transporter